MAKLAGVDSPIQGYVSQNCERHLCSVAWIFNSCFSAHGSGLEEYTYQARTPRPRVIGSNHESLGMQSFRRFIQAERLKSRMLFAVGCIGLHVELLTRIISTTAATITIVIVVERRHFSGGCCLTTQPRSARPPHPGFRENK